MSTISNFSSADHECLIRLISNITTENEDILIDFHEDDMYEDLYESYREDLLEFQFDYYQNFHFGEN